MIGFNIALFALGGCAMQHGGTASANQVSEWGLYTYGHEVRVFQPCGSETEWWAEADKEGVSEALEKASMAKAEQVGKPYQAVLAKIRHTLPEKATDGFAESYDAAVTITAVELIEPNGVCRES
ncbi:hypothetical protein [Suttonella ornithocola]|nr:hypothetical protein [Suttonella ornithocola]